MSAVSKYLDHFFNNQKKRLIKQEPRLDLMVQLAQLGVDKSLFYLHSKQTQKFISAKEQALKFRPRYRDLKIPNNKTELEHSISALKTIHSQIVDLPFKYFLHPLGIGHYLDLYDKISRDVSVQNVINNLNGSELLPKEMSVRRFDEQAVASLIFHSEVVSSYDTPTIEYDVNPGILGNEDSLRKLLEKADSGTLGKAELITLFNENENFSLALNRLSRNAQVRAKSWKNETYEKIYTLATQLPRWLRLADQPIDLLDKNYPKSALKLSSFTLINLTNSSFIAKKYAVLHNTGLKHVGDLVLFHRHLRDVVFK